jgi:hypothetical protein
MLEFDSDFVEISSVKESFEFLNSIKTLGSDEGCRIDLGTDVMVVRNSKLISFWESFPKKLSLDALCT